jgi:diaminopimelate epimerase
VRVEMGRVSFRSDQIPVSGPRREVINENISVGGRTFTFCAATVGNPHCVVVGCPAAAGCAPLSEISEALAKEFGPLLEMHANFPNRTNVQFLKVLDRQNIRIEIWERGAGYTLASGTSSSAAAAVARKLGLCDARVTVHMPGGRLAIEIGNGFDILMTGPVTRVAEGVIAEEMFSAKIAA